MINPTTLKINTGKTNKIQRGRCRIPNLKLKCVFEMPKDPMNYYLMCRVCESLKTRTQAHGELNV
jgi:hypothetical protein